MICDDYDEDQCTGWAREVIDPYLAEVHDERVVVMLCEFHYEERRDQI